MQQPAIIAPSILSANFARLGDEVREVLVAGAQWIHFDVMDNHYVPNLTVGPMVCAALRKDGIKAPIDVHLMVQPVDDLVRAFADAGASSISFHPDAVTHVNRTLGLIRDLGCKAGLALNLTEDEAILEYTLDDLDLILLMSVNPGFGGQTFIDKSLVKIKAVRAILDAKNSSARLQVDGGLNTKTIGAVARAGADTFVMGAAIFGAKDRTKAIKEIQQLL